MSRRLLPWAGTLGLIGVVALTLPSSVLADPGPHAVPAELTPGGSRPAGWEDSEPSNSTPRVGHSPDTRHRDTKPPHGKPTPGTKDTGTTDTGTATTGTTDTGTADTWIPDTGEGELGRVTEGVDGGDPDGPDGMPDGTGGGADEPSDTGPAGGPSPGSAERSPVALLQKLQTLYRQSEDSARAYRQTEDDLRSVRQQSDTLTTQLARARAQLAGGRADAGRLARLQYQSSVSPVSSYLRVLLARNPQQAMDTRHLIREAARDQRAAVARFTTGERKADALAAKAHAALDKQQALTDRARYQRETAAKKLKEVEALLATLSPEQLTELGRLEAQATDGMRRDDRPAEA